MTRAFPARYIVLSGAVLAIACMHVANRYWVGDYFAHIAVLRELMRRPLHPHHPILPVDAPTVLFTPYSSLLAAGATVFQVPPSAAMSAGAILNILLLLLGVVAASRALTRQRSEVYVLLAMLLLWGRQPWDWSGFLHLSAIGLTAPYPSTFAFALSLITIAILSRVPPTLRVFLTAAVASGVVLLSHPPAALALYAAIGAFVLNALAHRQGREALRLMTLVPLSVALTWLWPHYSFVEFTLSEASAFNAFHVDMYQGAFIRTAPALVGIPAVMARFRRSPTDPLALWFAATAAIYVLGWLTGHWNLGRVLPFVLLSLQMALAGELARLIDTWWPALSRTQRALAGVVAGVVIALAVANLKMGIVRAIPRPLLSASIKSHPSLYRPLDTYGVLDGAVEDEAIVLTRPDAEYLVAAVGVKLVGIAHYQAFVPDQSDRRHAVERFLSCQTTASERLSILQRFDVDYVLVHKLRDPTCLLLEGQLKHIGPVVLETDALRLIKTTVRHDPS